MVAPTNKKPVKLTKEEFALLTLVWRLPVDVQELVSKGHIQVLYDKYREGDESVVGSMKDRLNNLKGISNTLVRTIEKLEKELLNETK